VRRGLSTLIMCALLLTGCGDTKNEVYYQTALEHRNAAIQNGKRSFDLPKGQGQFGVFFYLSDDEFIRYIKRWDQRLEETVDAMTQRPPEPLKQWIAEQIEARQKAIKFKRPWIIILEDNAAAAVLPEATEDEFVAALIRTKAKLMLEWEFRNVLKPTSADEAQTAYRTMNPHGRDRIRCPQLGEERGKMLCLGEGGQEVWIKDYAARKFVSAQEYDESMHMLELLGGGS